MPEDRPWIRQKPRNLYIDIEVGYASVNVFDLRVRGEYIPASHIEKPRYIICWSAGWVGEKSPIISACVSPRAAIKHDDSKILPPLLYLMERADIISGQNVDQYDRKEINARMVYNDLTPVRGYKIMDSLKMLRKDYRFMSNTLDYISQVFGFRPKMAMSDKDWLAIARGDEKALRKMEKYNRNDVKIGIGVLEALLGIGGESIERYMRTLPSEPRDRRDIINKKPATR
jgi:hypothetical protein